MLRREGPEKPEGVLAILVVPGMTGRGMMETDDHFS